MNRSYVCTLLALALFLASGEAGTVLKYRQWNWNMKGNVLVIAYGSLRMHGNHPPYPDVRDPAGCASVCSDIAGCNGWTFCNKSEGCGTGCNNYLKSNPIIRSEDPSVTGRWGLPLSTKLSDLVRPGPFESLCRWSNNDTWSYGTCTLKVVTNTANPEFWGKNAEEGWVSGTIDRPPMCGTDIPARSCDKCFALGASGLTDQCIKCAKSTIKATSNPSPVIRTLLDATPVTIDGCAACMKLKDPSACVKCLKGSKKCGECALQAANIRLDQQSPEQKKQAFDVQTCLDCVLVNGEKTKDACISCGRLNSATKKSTCKSCVAAQKTRMCDYNAKPYNPDCVSADACAVCADTAKVPKTCTDCLKQKPYNPDCVSCAYNKDAAKQKKCYDCAKKKTMYNSESYSSAACYECTSLEGDDKISDCIEHCALRADLPLSVPRYWCNWCAKDRTVAEEWNKCYDCLVKNSTDVWSCNK